jgi:hypothetical protein
LDLLGAQAKSRESDALPITAACRQYVYPSSPPVLGDEHIGFLSDSSFAPHQTFQAQSSTLRTEHLQHFGYGVTMHGSVISPCR